MNATAKTAIVIATLVVGVFSLERPAVACDTEDCGIGMLTGITHLTPNCRGMEEGAKCWKKIGNRAACYVWDNHFFHDQNVLWSGICSDGVATGRGELRWSGPDIHIKMEGELCNGKMHGRWQEEYINGTVLEGHYEEGERHGDWVIRRRDGTCEEIIEYSHGKEVAKQKC